MATMEIDPSFERRLARWSVDRLDVVGRTLAEEARRNTPVRTGQAQASVIYEVDPDTDTVRVGSPLLKYRFLELGTARMAPRAPLRRALDTLSSRLGEVYLRGR